jgi:hypothetical protein
VNEIYDSDELAVLSAIVDKLEHLRFDCV